MKLTPRKLTKKSPLIQAQAWLLEETEKVADYLSKYDLKIVFAESCTGGLVSASLSAIPGASEYLCGSLVTYRTATKNQWLGISPITLRKTGVVSDRVAVDMAVRSLDITPEAHIAASITGHLGPNAPKALDGVIYTATAFKGGDDEVSIHTSKQKLGVLQGASAEDNRRWRQLAASHSVLMMVRSLLEQIEPIESKPIYKEN